MTLKEVSLERQACLRRFNEWEEQHYCSPRLTDIFAVIDAVRLLLPKSMRIRYDTSDYPGVARMHRLLACLGDGDDRS